MSILSERRALQPYGLYGGQPGARGLNLMKYHDGRIINLGGKNTITVRKGDTLTIFSPGGGGHGKKESNASYQDDRQSDKSTVNIVKTSGSLNQYTLNQESV